MTETGAGTPSFFPVSREAALGRLEAFLPKAGGDYRRDRNSDYGPDDRSNVSCLSPFHSRRLLLEEETARGAIDEHGMEAAEKFVQEVFWRTYFKGYLELRPTIWTRYRQKVRTDYEALTPERKKAYEAAISGATGIDCFDAWVRELVTVGYVHNHTRMWFASIWIFTLKLPWTLGADFFYRHLLDGDAASNTLSWRWVGGLHTVGKTYLATASNIRKYTEGRFDPEGQLAGKAEALSDDWNGEAGPLPRSQRPQDGARSILLLHEDDLGWDSLDLGGAEIAATAGITVTDDRSPFGAEELAKRFAIEAVEDALNRADDGLDADAVKLASPAGLVECAEEHGAATIITAYAPIGPVRDRLDALRPELEAAKIELKEIVRPFDAAAWPHCSKGFFGLKKKIPEVLGAL